MKSKFKSFAHYLLLCLDAGPNAARVRSSSVGFTKMFDFTSYLFAIATAPLRLNLLVLVSIPFRLVPILTTTTTTTPFLISLKKTTEITPKNTIPFIAYQ